MSFSFCFTAVAVLSSISILYGYGLSTGGPAVMVRQPLRHRWLDTANPRRTITPAGGRPETRARLSGPRPVCPCGPRVWPFPAGVCLCSGRQIWGWIITSGKPSLQGPALRFVVEASSAARVVPSLGGCAAPCARLIRPATHFTLCLPVFCPYSPVMTICIGCAMGEICSTFPSAGSVYHWAGQMGPPEWGPLSSFVCGWFNFLGNAAGDASFAYGFANVSDAFTAGVAVSCRA